MLMVRRVLMKMRIEKTAVMATTTMTRQQQG
jgi:hypothetical protein